MADDVPSHTILTAPGARPERLVLFLHGILGQGLNWRSFAKRLVADAPSWGAVLVDLRAHGDSRSLPPPDDLDHAAADLVRLRAALETPIAAAVGHSFGGKVALALLERERGALEALVSVDSLPGARPNARGSEGTLDVVEMLAALPDRFADRDAFRAHVTGLGFTSMLAEWLAQSLDRLDDGGYRFGLDVARIRALLDDYFRRDLWPAIDPPPDEVDVHLVIGGRSSVYDDDDRAHARRLAARHARVHCHVLDCDHWVHVEAPDALHDVVLGALS